MPAPDIITLAFCPTCGRLAPDGTRRDATCIGDEWPSLNRAFGITPADAHAPAVFEPFAYARVSGATSLP